MALDIFAQRLVYDRLIAFAIIRLLLEPGYDIRIDAQRKLLL